MLVLEIMIVYVYFLKKTTKHTHTHAHTRTHTRTRAHTHTHAHTQVHTHTHTHNTQMNTQTDSTTVPRVSIFYCMHVYTKKTIKKIGSQIDFLAALIRKLNPLKQNM